EHIVIDGTVEGDVKSRTSLKINGRVIGRIFYAGTIRLGENVTLEGSSITRVQAVGYVGSPQKEDVPPIRIDESQSPNA
ncbi:polymer-forming cytoskeletal protein, partial [Klebsiella quasipneumoniae]|uniref:polymer-forming cytoskeletal protein n=1 Tax=Klebsiella quasipneumoniae TaxID=1463165 RepID=UPI002033B34A